MLPGKQPSSFVVDSGDVTLASPVALNIEEKSKAESAEIHRRQTEINKRNKTRILTAPFRQASHLIWRAFLVLKSLLTPDGFIRMRVRGRNGTWKISQSAAWALDNGKVLDRLVKRGR